jgi:ABC-type sugar transport system substrate-binding protein
MVYKGVFVIPRDPSKGANKDRLKSHLSLHHDLPIVTLDVYPDDKEDPEYPHFVGGNEQVGGRCAATAAIRLLEKLRKDGQWAHLGGPRVLVLIGTITPWEIQRVTCFEDELLRWSKENEVDLHLVKSRPLKYEYQQAVEYLSNWKAQVDGEEVRLSDPLKTDLIFACSDTMALGAAKAIRQLRQRQPEGAGSRVKVIGYDGTIGMKRALDADSDVLAATVDVQLGEQAERAVEVMMNLMAGNPADRMKLVSPVVFEP